MRFNKPLQAVGLLLGLSSLNAEATLTSYASAGQSLVYSSVSDVSWTADGNLLGTLEASNPDLVNTIINTVGSISDTPNVYDTPSNSGYHALSTADFGANGLVSWFGAQAYVSYLNTINYAGSNQWVLPSAGTISNNYYRTGNQFNQLFFDELGVNAYFPAFSFPASANFTNGQSYYYWLGTESPSYSGNAWTFGSSLIGITPNTTTNKYSLFYAWAVSPGLVSAVPVPGAVWLFGSGLLGLLGLKRRRHAG